MCLHGISLTFHLSIFQHPEPEPGLAGKPEPPQQFCLFQPAPNLQSLSRIKLRYALNKMSESFPCKSRNHKKKKLRGTNLVPIVELLLQEIPVCKAESQGLVVKSQQPDGDWT